jgi:hypothetical protein
LVIRADNICQQQVFGVKPLSLAWPIFHESFVLPPGFFAENEEISTIFMKIGQPKLSENYEGG